MNAENVNDVEAGRVPPTNAVSIYGQNDAMDDFPVLKAFQQYIDAEQAKAQKRMTTLCIFFAIIMTIVVGVFVALLVNMAQDKNRISDQMIQFMLKERDHGPVVVQPPSGQTDATVKALTESMTNLQKQLADQQMKMVEQQNKFFEQRAQDAARRAKEEVESEMGQPPSKAQVDLAKKNQQDIAKIKKASALLQKQKEELAKEKERLRQKEIELQRRKLYPELVAGFLNRDLQSLLGGLFLCEIYCPVHPVHELYLGRLIVKARDYHRIAHAVAPETAQVCDDKLIYLSFLKLIHSQAFAEVITRFNGKEFHERGGRSKYAVIVIYT